MSHSLRIGMSMKNIMRNTLAISVLAAISQTAMANTQAQEIEQLRQEVNALKALIQSQQQTAVVVNTSPTQAVVEQQKQKPKLLSGAEVSLYGNVRLDASYQTEGSAASRMYNNINKVPLEGQAEASERLKSTLSATRLGMDVKTQIHDQTVAGKIEVDFLGGAGLDNLRVRHAYLNYANWLIGQTWSNFAIPDYMPETIDALGYVGGAVKRTPQVRYTHHFSPTTNLVLAAEDPKDASINLQTPALTARLNHQINDAGKLSLRSMLNEKPIQQDETWAWGVGLGLQYKIHSQTTLKADYYHVKGDSSFVSWTNPGFSLNASGKIEDENEFDSITVGLTQQFNEKWRGTLGVGYMQADISEAYKQGFSSVELQGINDKQWQAWANVFYSPIKPVSFGLEYVYGEREAVGSTTQDHNIGEDNRFNAVAIYSF